MILYNFHLFIKLKTSSTPTNSSYFKLWPSKFDQILEKILFQKKALQDLKTPKPEPERTPQVPKRPTEARDAREVAKKLIKSGIITAPKTPKRMEQAFKRPRGLERKLNSTEKTVCSYQPFSSMQSEEEETEPARPRVKDLYESFVSAQEPDDKSVMDKSTPVKSEPKAKSGNTIFVTGHKITEDFLKKSFMTFGNILNIHLEPEKKWAWKQCHNWKM